MTDYEYNPDENGMYVCPECGNVFKPSGGPDPAQGLKVHRSRTHGVNSTSRQAVSSRAKRERERAMAGGTGSSRRPPAIKEYQQDLAAMVTVRAAFPKGIQTSDLGRLLEDIYWIDQLRMRLREAL